MEHSGQGVNRATMEATLKKHCIPTLRAQGFRGAYPHLYRSDDSFVALITFQFFSSGGSFCINLGYADPARKNVTFKPETAVPKLRVNATRDQRRLGQPSGGGDHWFSYGLTSYGVFRGTPEPPEDIAEKCADLIMSEGEAWWRTKMTPGP
ncbi:DUF4304 domain-containing protein [Sulfitobacter aestuariivivens]|uniref:DUF4304 domain-containing protein n=1 Tax=Sulfitobacter aestuariivivens TaxID=2766981 RepID=A0A927HDZ8_9RHOB|nr:DUF4304 domain-containing protein [Sulfitobacter aestuariivivens]MBD3662829.1 DUF4304 domain-containing protein [Sulfitobacter aestuariivivens]